MTFTKQLFQMTGMTLPNMNAKIFSRYLGRSEGYYGSVSAQKLDISTNSLLHFSEVLEQKKLEHPNAKIAELQNLIADEIARRMEKLESQNLAVRQLLIRAVANRYMQQSYDYAAPAIVLG